MTDQANGKVTTALTQAMNAGTLVEIGRAQDDELLYGVVLGQSEELVLVHQWVDFYWDGLRVLRLDDVAEVQPAENEAVLRDLMKRLGDPRPTELKVRPILEDWASCFESLRGHAVGIDEVLEDDELVFSLGRVVKLDRDAGAVTMSPVSPAGDVGGNEQVSLDTVVELHIDSRYVQAYAQLLAD